MRFVSSDKETDNDSDSCELEVVPVIKKHVETTRDQVGDGNVNSRYSVSELRRVNIQNMYPILYLTESTDDKLICDYISVESSGKVT
jgi:hypothetical protein